MKCNYNPVQATKDSSLNRAQRRALKEKLAPIAKKFARLEKNIRNNIDKEQSEAEISEIIDKLTLIEMMALEDYIMDKNLIDKV